MRMVSYRVIDNRAVRLNTTTRVKEGDGMRVAAIASGHSRYQAWNCWLGSIRYQKKTQKVGARTTLVSVGGPVRARQASHA